MNEERCEYYEICTTDCDCTLEDTECCSLYELHDKLKRLEQKYNEVLKLAKKNADSNEYVIQELEKENEKLKLQIAKQRNANIVDKINKFLEREGK